MALTLDRRTRWEAAFGASASLTVHVVVAIALWSLPPAETLAIDRALLEQASESVETPTTARGEQPGEAAPLVLGGASASQNVDEGGGDGGDFDGAVAFTLLVSRAHPVHLQDSVNNSARVSQAQRIRTAQDRASYENRRATPNAASAPFLASGAGTHAQRRRISTRDAAHGSITRASASVVGDREDARATGAAVGAGSATALEGSDGSLTQDARAGAEHDAAGQGIAAGRGVRATDAARVAHARPDLDPGPAATLASRADRVRDDVDSEHLAAMLVQSTVDASRRAGRLEGPGRGGRDGDGAVGTHGGASGGGRSTPHTPGAGDGGLDTSSGRYRTWYLALRDRIEDALVFPRERSLALDQGLVVYRLSISRSGRLHRSPHRVRSSGFDDFDRAARAAILETAPFAQVPADIAPGREVLSVDLTIAFQNPLIH